MIYALKFSQAAWVFCVIPTLLYATSPHSKIAPNSNSFLFSVIENVYSF